MTKRDYTLLSDVLGEALSDIKDIEERAGASYVIRALAAELASVNGKFDLNRFLVDCGLNP